jgi:hypothetical protein
MPMDCKPQFEIQIAKSNTSETTEIDTVKRVKTF